MMKAVGSLIECLYTDDKRCGKRQNRHCHYERYDKMETRLSASRKCNGDIPTKQCLLYRHQQRYRQLRPKYIGICPLYQYHVRVVCKGHQQES